MQSTFRTIGISLASALVIIAANVAIYSNHHVPSATQVNAVHLVMHIRP